MTTQYMPARGHKLPSLATAGLFLAFFGLVASATAAFLPIAPHAPIAESWTNRITTTFGLTGHHLIYDILLCGLLLTAFLLPLGSVASSRAGRLLLSLFTFLVAAALLVTTIVVLFFLKDTPSGEHTISWYITDSVYGSALPMWLMVAGAGATTVGSLLVFLGHVADSQN